MLRNKKQMEAETPEISENEENGGREERYIRAGSRKKKNKSLVDFSSSLFTFRTLYASISEAECSLGAFSFKQKALANFLHSGLFGQSFHVGKLLRAENHGQLPG